MRDSAGQPTGQTVTYDGKSGDFVWVDSAGYLWTVVDGQRLFKTAPDGRLDEVRAFRLLPKITGKVVLGNNAYFLGKDNTGKNVVQKVILEDPSDSTNNWTVPWQIELGDIAPTSIAVDPAGDKVYLGGNTAVGQEVPGLLKNDGTILQPIGARSGPNDGYLIQLTASTGNPDWMMYIGGDGTENVTAIAARSDGTVWVMGDTDSRPNDSTGPWTPSYWIKGGVQGADISFYDSGAGSRDGFVVSVKTDDRVAAIAVSGSGNAAISDGDNTPSRTDGTDLGRTAVGSPITQSYTIRNTGNGRLTLTNPSLPTGFTFAAPLPAAIEAGQSATFSVRLDADANLPLGVKTGSVSFTTNDPSKPVFDFQIRGELLAQVLPEFSVANIAVVEGNSGTTAATFTVSASPAIAAGRTASVAYRIVAGTATAGRDFQVVNGGVGTLTFNPGESSKTVSVNVIGDRIRESNETFRIVLSGATGATLGVAEATATISDDDTSTTPVGSLPGLTFENVRASEDTGRATVVVRLSSASQSAVSVQYVTADGTARAGTDYTRVTGKLQFAAGETSKTIEIPLVGDAGAEADEAFTLRFSSPVNASLPSLPAATVTILNDDAATSTPVPAVSNPSLAEGNTGRPSMRFTITLSAAATQTITYGVRTGVVGDTAVAGVDYVALREGATVTFRAGQQTATVVVSVIANTTVNGDRRLALQLLNAGGSVVASGIGTIRDDDVATTLASALAAPVSSSSSTTSSRLRVLPAP